MAALRNTRLAIVHDLAEPLTEIRDIVAENRSKAIVAARHGVLRMTLATALTALGSARTFRR